MIHSRLLSLALLTGALLVVASMVNADTVQLLNGDNVSGKVVSLDDKHLKLQSEVFGQLSIERSKIAAIYLGDAAPKAPAPQAQAAAKPPQPQDVLKGINPGTIDEIKKAFPLLATPGAGKYFDNAVSGLMSGKIGVQDIRKDAMKVIDEVNKLEKELGPQATEALRPYVSILENFIRESEPTKPGSEKPAPPKK